jgi:hypothetical protein
MTERGRIGARRLERIREKGREKKRTRRIFLMGLKYSSKL